MLKIKISKRDFFGKILFIMFAISWGYGEYIDNINDDFKYIFALINMGVIVGTIIIKRKKLKEMFLYKELKQIAQLAIFSAVISVFLQLINGRFLIIAYKEIFYLLFPIVYAFLLWNNKEDNVDFYFNTMLIVFVACFFLKFKSIFSLNNILNISFKSSYSAFESPYSSIFLQLFIYYFYRKNKKFYLISAFFCFLSLKRLDLLFLIAFPFIYKICNNKKFSTKQINIIKLFFILSPFLIKFMYSNEFTNYLKLNYNISLNELTTGRVRLMQYLMNSNLKNSGLGTIEQYLIDLTGETNLHCDMYKFYFETTIIGVIILVNNYFNIVKENKTLTFVMLYLFFTMLFSHCITSVMMWFLFFMTVGYVKKNENLKRGDN